MLDMSSLAIANFRHRSHAKRRHASETLLRLYVSFQRTRAKVARKAGVAAGGDDLTARCDELTNEIKRGIGNPHRAQNPAWVDAYEIERDLLVLQAGPPLLQSLTMLLDRAEAVRTPAAKSLRRAYEAILAAPRAPAASAPQSVPAQVDGGGPATAPATPPSDDLVRPLALAALEAVQWIQAKRFEVAPSKRGVVHRLVGSGLLAFALFVLPYVWFDGEALTQQHIHERDWSWLPLWTALSAGLLGAFFSRLLTVQKYFPEMSIDDVERVGEWNSILLRGAVGMIGALVVLIFLQSGLPAEVIGAKLFPDFEQMRFGRDAVPGVGALPTASLALLVVWSFIAGFSERIVPRILAKTEAQLTAAATADGGAAKA